MGRYLFASHTIKIGHTLRIYYCCLFAIIGTSIIRSSELTQTNISRLGWLKYYDKSICIFLSLWSLTWSIVFCSAQTVQKHIIN